MSYNAIYRVFYFREVSISLQQANDNYINIEAAAEYLGVSVITVRNWLKRDDVEIPAHRIGKLWKFKRSELDDWVKSGKSANV